MRARVLVRPKEGILDPQGEAVERALPALGFGGVSEVRIGRMVELEIDDPSQLEEISGKLLANPLVEDFEIELLDPGAQSSSASCASPAAATRLTRSSPPRR